MPVVPDVQRRHVVDILEVMPERVVRYTRRDRRILYCNQSWALGHGAEPQDLVGLCLDDLLTPAALDGMHSQLAGLGPETPSLNDPKMRRAPDASERWLSWVDQLLADGDEVLSIGRDVTDQHTAEIELAASEARFRSLVDRSVDVVFGFAFAPVPHFTYLSPSVERFLGHAREFFLDDFGRFYEMLDDDGRALITSALYDSALPERYDLTFLRPDGRVVIGEMQITYVDGGLQGISRDVTEMRTLQAELEALALRDPLTGLANRRLLDELLAAAIQRNRRSETDLAIAFVDLDGFKGVNDTHGHETGDAVLREVVRRMLTTVRDADVVARVGGDEFVIVHDTMDRDHCDLVSRLDRVLAEPIDVGDISVSCPASIGEVRSSRIGWEPAALLAAADAAMYAVKRSRRARHLI